MTDEELYGSDIKLQVEADPGFYGLGADLKVSKKGDLQVVLGRENLGQALMHRLLTRKGELSDLGHPAYGSRLHELIGLPNNQSTRDLVRLYAKECIMEEPRVKSIVEITVTPSGSDRHAVILDVTVLPIKTTVPMNLVFPYYIEVSE
jgi:phage baseplate assembly protein W